MKKITLIISALVAFLQVTIAQTKLLTMEEALVKQWTTIAPAKLRQLMWVKGSDYYSFVDTKNNQDVLIIGKAEGGKKDTIALARLNDALKIAGIKSLKAFPAIQWKNEKAFYFEAEKQLLTYDIRSKKINVESSRDFGDEAENRDATDDQKYVAFTVKNNLYVYNGKGKIAVTNDVDENIVNGKSVHREEFGIMKGTFWSPKGNLLAFYRMDQTMVTDYPIIDWTVRPAKNNNIKYPMAGDKSHEVTVGIYSVTNNKTIFLKTGEPKEQYLTNIAWSPDEQHVYIAVLNRDQNHLKLNSYNALTGDFEKTLFEEKSDKYVHPVNPLVFLPNNPNQFVWQSERDGYNHLYLYDTNGNLIKQLTKGNWVVIDFAGFDTKGENAFYTSTAESPVTRNFYSVSIKTGAINKITSGEGTHTALFNNNYIIDNFQSTTIPREISIYNTKGKKLQVLKNAENPLSNYQLGALNIFKLKSENGDDLYCRLYQPINFDSTKKYPVIVYLYNGPGVQLINNTWNGGGDLWFQYMAERGFVVFTIDGRGTDNK